MKRFARTLTNLVTGADRRQEIEQLYHEVNDPWQWTDWLAAGIVAFIVFLLVAFS